MHDGEKVLAMIEDEEKTITESFYTIVDFESNKECMAEIEKLKLEYDAGEQIYSDIGIKN